MGLVYFALAVAALMFIEFVLKKVINFASDSLINSGRKFDREVATIFETSLTKEDSYKQIYQFVTNDQRGENLMGIRDIQGDGHETILLDMKMYSFQLKFRDGRVRLLLSECQVDSRGNIAIGLKKPIDLVPKFILKALKGADPNARQVSGKSFGA